MSKMINSLPFFLFNIVNVIWIWLYVERDYETVLLCYYTECSLCVTVFVILSRKGSE